MSVFIPKDSDDMKGQFIYNFVLLRLDERWRVQCVMTCSGTNIKGNFRKERQQARRHVHVTSGEMAFLYWRTPRCRSEDTILLDTVRFLKCITQNPVEVKNGLNLAECSKEGDMHIGWQGNYFQCNTTRRSRHIIRTRCHPPKMQQSSR
jgi:hypothetical protein